MHLPHAAPAAPPLAQYVTTEVIQAVRLRALVAVPAPALHNTRPLFCLDAHRRTGSSVAQFLDENQNLILTILENQNMGKLEQCAQCVHSARAWCTSTRAFHSLD